MISITRIKASARWPGSQSTLAALLMGESVNKRINDQTSPSLLCPGFSEARYVLIGLYSGDRDRDRDTAADQRYI
jgi:hypothetical protein